MKVLRILGIRGLPAAHGGFETFAEHLAPYLIERGWRVVVYCQHEGSRPTWEDEWNGVERVHISVPGIGAASSVVFDWRATRHAAAHHDLCLTLGYNTAVFCARLRFMRVRNVINMDGIEWARAKWGPVARAWFWMNDWAGCWLGDHLIADHPAIADHLATRTRRTKITMIPYGADDAEQAPESAVRALGLEPGNYATLIARPEPENSVLEAVTGFSRQRRGIFLVVLGNYSETNPYHRAVRAAASDEVKFLGAIYDPEVVRALRCHCLFYVHGHRVGGTNPSLVEALGAGNAVLAHDNRFNRWVAGEQAQYFSDVAGVEAGVSRLLTDATVRAQSGQASRARFLAAFTWPAVLSAYEELLSKA